MSRSENKERIKPHRIYKCKGQTIPRTVIFFDTETRQSKGPDGSVIHTLRLGWACYYRPATGGKYSRKEVVRWKYFTDAADFWLWVDRYTRVDKKTYLIAHNIGFDFLILRGPEYIKHYEWKRRVFYDKGLTTLITFRRKDRSLIMLSSTNYFPFSLAKLGEIVGLDKMHVDFDDVDERGLSVYCKNDVEILLRTFRNYFSFLRDNRFGSFKHTKASQALTTFRTRFMQHKIYVHRSVDIAELERKAYYGGRVECFSIGKQPDQEYYVLDVNSLYPSVMIDNYYPVKFIRKIDNPDISYLERIIKDYCIIGKFRVKTDEPVYPFRDKYLIFPVGSYTVHLNTPEIEYAIKHGDIIDCEYILLYERGKIFHNYVKVLYELRKQYKEQGNKIYTQLTKDLLNSLYGKFAQHNVNWEIIGECNINEYTLDTILDRETGNILHIRKVLGVIEIEQPPTEGRNTMISISSHVTAFARLKLWEYIKQAGFNNVFYVDTDSIFTNFTGYTRLKEHINDYELGKLKLEKTSRYFIINGLKDYVFGDKVKLKGISKSAEQLSDNTYRMDIWNSLRTAIKSNKAGEFTVRPIIKVLNRKYNKGIISQRQRVLPFRFG